MAQGIPGYELVKAAIVAAVLLSCTSHGCAGPMGKKESRPETRDSTNLKDRILAGERKALESAISMLASHDPAKRQAAEDVLVQIAQEYGPYLRAAVRRRDATTPGLLRVLALAGGEKNIAHLERLSREQEFAAAAREALEVAEQKCFEHAGFDPDRLKTYKRFFPEGLYIAEVEKRLRMVDDPRIWQTDPALSNRLKAALAHMDDITGRWSSERKALARDLLSRFESALTEQDLDMAEKWVTLAEMLAPSLKKSLALADYSLARGAASSGEFDRALDALDRAVSLDPGIEAKCSKLRKRIFQQKVGGQATYELRVVRVEVSKKKKRALARRKRYSKIRVTVKAGGRKVSASALSFGREAKLTDAPPIRVKQGESLVIFVNDDGESLGEFGPAQLPITGLQGEAELEFDDVSRLVLEYKRVR